MPNFRNLVNPKKSPFFYGWVILLVGAVGVVITAPGQTIGVSVFTDHLLTALEMSRDELSVAYMLGTMLSAAMLTRAGKFFDKYGAIRTSLIASVGLGTALFYMSQIDKISTLLGGQALVTMACIFIGFVFVRFFGQGVLTLASRTMVVKWFDAKRGLAVGILSAITAYGHSVAPVVFDHLIEEYGWSMAWVYIGVFCILIFPIFIFLFFKRGPENYGLIPDGVRNLQQRVKKLPKFPVYKDYNLQEARSTFSLWIFAGLPALYGLVVTGVSFHVISIFKESGLGKEMAINVFQPLAIVAVVVTIITSYLSDFIKLKYIALIFSLAGLFAMLSVINLYQGDLFYTMLIISFGISSGIHPLIITLFLPRFFGKEYLGAITGQAMTLVVFASALGPILFSQSLTMTGKYNLAAYVCGVIYTLLLCCVLFTRNPQLQHKPKA